MPFDLFVSHAPTFERIDHPGLFRRQQAIQPDEFAELISSGPCTQRPNGDYWVRHPEDDSPWLAARLTDKGTIVLSCRYTNHRYLRNFADAFDLGIRLAETLNANLFEEVRGEAVTRKVVDTLLEPNGRYFGMQIRTFNDCIQGLDQEARGPLEYPLGPIDAVGEYCVIHAALPPVDPPTLTDLMAFVSLPAQPTDLDGNHTFLCNDSGKPVTKLLLRSDRRIQLWPCHGQTSFAEAAGTTFESFRAISSILPGDSMFNFQPFTPDLQAEVAQRSKGLGVDFYEWTCAPEQREAG